MYPRPGLRSRWMTTFNESAILVFTARYGKSVRFATRSSRIDRVLVGHHLRGSSKELANALLVGPSPSLCSSQHGPLRRAANSVAFPGQTLHANYLERTRPKAPSESVRGSEKPLCPTARISCEEPLFLRRFSNCIRIMSQTSCIPSVAGGQSRPTRPHFGALAPRTESRAAVSTNVSSLPEISGTMGMKEVGRRTEVANLLSQASLRFPVDVGTLFSFLPVESRHGVVLRFNSRCN